MSYELPYDGKRTADCATYNAEKLPLALLGASFEILALALAARRLLRPGCLRKTGVWFLARVFHLLILF